MTEHWNIQINIQRVDESQQPGSLISGKPPIDKKVTEVLKLAVVADSEAEAFEKVQRHLTASHPDVVVVPAGVTVAGTADGRYRPIRDNPQA